MKKTILCALMLCLLVGCGTRHHEMTYANGQDSIEPTAKYAVGNVEDVTGFAFPEGEEGIDISQSMQTALVEELKEEGLLAESEDAYRIDVTVEKYEPGNAFGRWLFPGVGSTKLQASSNISHAGEEVGTIATRNTVDIGGAFSIGAWKTIFKTAAAEIITELKKTMGLVQERKKK